MVNAPPTDSLSRQQLEDVERALDVLDGRTIAFATGAGVSTDSGIPDYRGAGSLPRTPMSISQFLDDEGFRRRYWAGSQLGWARFSSVRPNPAHFAIADLERAGLANGVITQNVDGLHHAAGSTRVVELHGTMARVRCTVCGRHFSRASISGRLAEDNPWLSTVGTGELGPDGDVQIDSDTVERLRVPGCEVCGGTLRPDIVYFGELIPRETFEAAQGIIDTAGALVIAGSSLAVNSGIRLLERARRAELPIVIINRGATKGDARASLKIDAGVGPVLTALAERLIAT